MNEEFLTLIIGITGATLVLFAFLMNQFNKWQNNNFYYDLINFVGSLFLIIYAILLSSFPFVILNSIWAAFSLKDLFRKRRE